MLNELKVIDASTVLAGPSVGSFFAELGADVIKIEHPANPDVTRSWKTASEDSNCKSSAYFSSVNYLKSYYQLNLTNQTDYSEFIKLINNADILITNFKKGDDVKLKITDEILRKINPSLIIGKINGYGEESNRVAYDLILQAESGFMSINGTPESGPVKMPVALIDVLAAHHLKEGILLSLYERSKGLTPRTINVSLYDVAVSSLTNQATNYLMTGKVPERIGSLHPNIAPYGEIFNTSDDYQITLAIGSDTHFKKLCSILELTHLITDERYITNQDRVEHRTELATLLGREIKKWNADELLSLLQESNVPAGRIKNIKEVFETERAKSLVRKEIIEGEETQRVTSVVFK